VRPLLKEIPDLTKSFLQKRTNCLLFNYDELRRLEENIAELIRQIGETADLSDVYTGLISSDSLSAFTSEIPAGDIILAGCNGLEIDGPGFSWTLPALGLIRHQLEQLTETIALEIGPAWTKQNTRFTGVELSIAVPATDHLIFNNLAPLVRRELSGTLLRAEQSGQNIRISPRDNWDRRMFIQKIVSLLPHASGLCPAIFYFGAENRDEPAFRETNLYGYSVLLRENIGRKTNARYYQLSKLLIWLNSL